MAADAASAAAAAVAVTAPSATGCTPSAPTKDDEGRGRQVGRGGSRPPEIVLAVGGSAHPKSAPVARDCPTFPSTLPVSVPPCLPCQSLANVPSSTTATHGRVHPVDRPNSRTKASTTTSGVDACLTTAVPPAATSSLSDPARVTVLENSLDATSATASAAAPSEGPTQLQAALPCIPCSSGDQMPGGRVSRSVSIDIPGLEQLRGSGGSASDLVAELGSPARYLMITCGWADVV